MILRRFGGGDEEENTPSSVPQQFRSTTPSQTRAQREAAGHRGHGQIRFSKDLSRAWVDVRGQLWPVRQ